MRELETVKAPDHSDVAIWCSERFRGRWPACGEGAVDAVGQVAALTLAERRRVREAITGAVRLGDEVAARALNGPAALARDRDGWAAVASY
jgi:hypothetical protein